MPLREQRQPTLAGRVPARPDHMRPGFQPVNVPVRQRPDDRQRELRRADAERFMSGNLTPMERSLSGIQQDPGKWKRERALNYFLSDKFNQPAAKVGQMPDVYRRLYFGDMDINQAYERMLELRGADSDPLADERDEQAPSRKEVADEYWGDFLARREGWLSNRLLDIAYELRPSLERDFTLWTIWTEQIMFHLGAGTLETGAAASIMSGFPNIARELARESLKTAQIAHDLVPEDVREETERVIELAAARRNPLILYLSPEWRATQTPSGIASAIQFTALAFLAAPFATKLAGSGAIARLSPKMQQFVRSSIMATPGAVNISLATAGVGENQAATDALQDRIEYLREIQDRADVILESMPDEAREQVMEAVTLDLEEAEKELENRSDVGLQRQLVTQHLAQSTIRHVLSGSILLYTGGLARTGFGRMLQSPTTKEALAAVTGLGIGTIMAMDDEMYEQWATETISQSMATGVNKLWSVQAWTPRLMDMLTDPDKFSSAWAIAATGARGAVVQGLTDVQQARSLADRETRIRGLTDAIREAGGKDDAPAPLRDLAQKLEGVTDGEQQMAIIQKSERDRLDRAAEHVSEATDEAIALQDVINETEEYRARIDEANAQLEEELAAVRAEEETETAAEPAEPEAAPPRLAHYQDMPYRDLQARAKELGIKANQKRDQLAEQIARAETGEPETEFRLTDRAERVERRTTAINQAIADLQQLAPEATAAQVVSDPEQLPQSVRDEATRQFNDPQAYRRIGGARDQDGTIYLVASNLTAQEAVATWIHEQVHDAIRAAGPERLAATVDSLTESLGADADTAGVPEQYRGMDMRTQTEEYVAFLADQVLNERDLTPEQRTAWQRVVDWFRELLSELFGTDQADMLAERIQAARDDLTTDQARELADVLRGVIRDMRGEREGVAVDEASPDIRFRLTQPHRESPEHHAAVQTARRILDGEAPNETMAREVMRGTGLEAEPGNVLRMAREIADEIQIRLRDFESDQQINAALRDAELRRHYQQQVQDIYSSGRADGAIQEQARQRLSEMRARQRDRDVRLRRGLSVERLEAAGIDVMTMIQEAIAPQDTVSDQTLSELRETVKTAVRDQMIYEGRFTRRREQYERDPVWRAEYAKTMRRTLDLAAQRLVPGFKREGIRVGLRDMERRTTTAAIDRAADEAIRRIQAEQTRQTRKELRNRIDRLLRIRELKGRMSATEELFKRTMHPEAEKWLRQVKQIVRMPERVAAQRMAEIEDRINGQPPDDVTDIQAWQDDLLDELKALQQYSALGKKTNVELEHALHTLEQEIQEGRERAAQIRDERKQRLGAWAEDEIAAITPREGKEVTPPPEPTKRAAAADYFTGLFSLRRRLHDMIRFGEQRAYETAEQRHRDLTNRIEQAYQARETEQRLASEELNDTLKSIYREDPLRAMRDLNRPRDEYRQFSKKNQALSKAQLLQIYVTAQQPEYADNIEKHGRDGKYLEDLTRQLTPEDMALVDWLRDWYDQSRDELSAVSERVTGVPVEQPNPLYMPAVMDIPTSGLEDVHLVARIVPKALTPRIRHGRDLDESAGILDVWMSRLEDMSQFKAYGELSLDIRGVYGRANLQAEVERTHGADYRRQLINHFSDVVRGHFPEPGNRTVDATRRLFALTKLSWNLGVGIRQVASAPAFAFEIGFKNTFKYIGTAFTPEGIATMQAILNSDQARNRLHRGNSEAVANAMRGRSTNAIARFFRSGMIVNRYGDIIPTLLVGQGIYRSYRAEALERGMGEDAAHQYGLNKLFEIAENTQQSPAIKDLAEWQRRAGSFGRLAGQFATTLRQYAEYEISAVRDMMAGTPGAPSRLARALALNHILLPAIFNGLSLIIRTVLGDEPDEDDIKWILASMIAGPAGGLIVFGSLAQAGISALLDDPTRHYQEMIPAGGLMKDAGDAALMMRHLTTGDVDEAGKALDRLLRSNFAPYRDAKRFYQNYMED